MTEAFATNLRKCDFNAAFVADDATMLHALVLSAQAFPVGYGPEDPRAEQAVFFRLERAVVDCLRLRHFAVGPGPYLFRRSQTDTDAVEIGNRGGAVVWVRSNQGNTSSKGENKFLRSRFPLHQFHVKTEAL